MVSKSQQGSQFHKCIRTEGRTEGGTEGGMEGAMDGGTEVPAINFFCMSAFCMKFSLFRCHFRCLFGESTFSFFNDNLLIGLIQKYKLVFHGKQKLKC